MNETIKEKTSAGELLRMTAEVTAAYVGNNSLPAAQLPEVIKTIYSSISALDGGAPVGASGLKPIVPIKKSIAPDYIVCLEDGKKLKMLKRHLRTSYGMTPEEYRIKWGLPRRLPDGRPQLCRAAFGVRQEDRPWPQAGAPARPKAKK